MPQIAKIETLHKGWDTISLATIRLDDGQMITRVVEDHGRVAVVLPYDPVRKCAILVRQFRAPPFFVDGRTDLLEAIAGIVEDGDAQDCAKRESMEEAGLRLQALEPVACAWSTPGLSTERMDLFLAPFGQTDRVGDGGGLDAEQERITVVELPLRELAAMADGGRLEDLKTFALVQTLRLRQPELFREP